MHHVKPTSKGDPLCPLGFHPQVRWPTRCKRCFRDYKEHGNRGKDSEPHLYKDELTVSTPVLSTTSSRNRLDPVIPEGTLGTRSWTSSSNLNSTGISNKNDDSIISSNRLSSTSSSWTSTPNLADSKEEVSVSITLPRRRSKPPEPERQEENTYRRTKPLDTGQADDDARRTQYTVRRRTSPGLTSLNNYYNDDSSESKATKVSLQFRPRSQQRDDHEPQRDTHLSVHASGKRFSPLREVQKIQTKGKTLIVSTEDTSSEDDSSSVSSFAIVRKPVDIASEYKAELDQLKKELEAMKVRCEKAEREKSDILMRRLDVSTTRGSSSEIVKLQTKVNELRNTVDDLQVDKKNLTQKIRDMQYDMDSNRGTSFKRENEALKEKLKAAEKVCKELMEANDEMKKELKEMEDEMDEMHDKFREDRADEYTLLKKELDQATKNCRILSFKLRKAERKSEQLEIEKFEAEQRIREVAGGQSGLDKAERIKQLEHDLNVANETASRLQKELEEQKLKNSEKEKASTIKKKPPKLGSVPKTPSAEKVSRESLTRGDSQEDPVQLLRDLQDSLEREADLREQLRFAEEEILRLQMKKKLNKFTPDVISTEVLAKVCELDSAEIQQILQLTDVMMQQEFYKSQKKYLNASQQTISLLLNDQISQTECNYASTGLYVTTSADDTQAPNLVMTDNCSQIQIDNMIYIETNSGLCKYIDKGIQYECEKEKSPDYYEDLSIVQDNRSSTNKSGALAYSKSMPELLQKVFFEACSQTDLKLLIPLLNVNAMSPGLMVAHTPVMTPLAALLMPLARRHSPSHQRLTPEPVEKDEGISDEDDPSELRILLELNEQEAAVLRRKVEELECEGNMLKRKVKELQEKLSSKAVDAGKERRTEIQQSEPKKSNAVYEQKMKVLEEEMSELRKKVIEKERECERLHAEISVGTKKPKTLQKSKSLDMDQQTVDLKRQLQVIENEASILRTKIQNLETENDKLQKENSKLSLLASKRAGSVERASDSKAAFAALEKQLEESKKKIKELEEAKEKRTPGSNKSDPTTSVAEVEKLKIQLKKMEAEKKKNEEALQRLRDEALPEVIQFYKSRTPKKPTDLTTKIQLKKMVDELESEISDMLVILRKTEDSRKQLSEATRDNKSEDLREAKEKFERLIQEAKEECKKKDVELERLNQMVQNLESDKIKVMRERDNTKTKFEKEIEKLIEAKAALEKHKKEALEQVDKLKSDLKKTGSLQNDIEALNKHIDSLKKELDEEKKNSNKLKLKLEVPDKISSENSKLLKEVNEAKKKAEDLESKLAEVEEKLKKSEKLASAKKDKVLKLDKEYNELNKKYIALEKDLEAANISKQELVTKFEESEERITKLKADLERKNFEIKKLVRLKMKESAAKLKEKVTKNIPSSDSQLQEELNSTNMKLKEVNEKLEEANRKLKEKEDEMAKKEKELLKQIEEWEQKASDLEMDMQANRKAMERLKTTQEREMKAKEMELNQLRQSTAASGQKKMTELQDKIDSLELALESEKHEYEELTKRYEELEEEHVVVKATLVKDKENIQSQLVKAANELEDVENELRSLKESYGMKQDYWVKERHKFEEKIKDNETLQLEKSHLLAMCDEKQSEIDQLKKEVKCFAEQINYLKKDNDELKSKLDDYENLDRVQRNVSGTTSLENELMEYKTRLEAVEKARKKETSSLRMKYENRLTLISEEIISMQTHMTRFKKERDSYKQLLEAARKNIADLKSSGYSLSKDSGNENELRTQVASLEQQLGTLEDELSESRLEASKLRTELNTERSNWEIRVAELTSRLNEMEEEKILSSGRTRVTGTKTRMELAWQKEREEQHRLLQETSTLARDLRQTLFEVERERDRERLEYKRKMDQIKKGNEEEQEEIRKKLNEMQCDLLELRDAHAKLRTTNEKLRREKDRIERDRDLLKQSINIKKKIEQEEERQIISVAQLVEELTILAPDLFPSKPLPPKSMPTPPVRRKGPKSREASPNLDRKDYSRESSVGREDAKSQEVQEILRRLTEAANELKKVQQEDRVSFRKAFGSFRSSSVESDGGMEASSKVKRRNLQKKPSVLRKSLSLEQTTQDQQVWDDNEKEGSMSSIQSLEDSERIRQAHLLRDMSLDSRLSGGSTQSEIIPSDKKKKLGLFGKLKKLTKSRSIDQDSDMGSTGQLDPGSDSSLNIADDRSGGKPFKSKLSGMFKKSGSTSRGNSMERNLKASTPVSDSTQRPLISSGAASPGEASKPLVKKPPATAPVQRKTFKK